MKSSRRSRVRSAEIRVESYRVGWDSIRFEGRNSQYSSPNYSEILNCGNLNINLSRLGKSCLSLKSESALREKIMRNERIFIRWVYTSKTCFAKSKFCCSSGTYNRFYKRFSQYDEICISLYILIFYNMYISIHFYAYDIFIRE